MSRLAPQDVMRLATRGLRGHPLRFALSALGIAIGVASMVAVAGITQSSKSDLNRTLADLGTNILRVHPVPDLEGEPTRLPPTATRMIGAIGPVRAASGVSDLTDVGVYRSPYVPTGNTNSVVATAVDLGLLSTLRGEVDDGRWFTATTSEYPVVVLGATAARRLAIDTPGVRLWIAGRWATVVGILKPLALAPELDSSAMLPLRGAGALVDLERSYTGIYVRTVDTQVVAVADVLARTASPQHPEQVGIARPTDALTAKLAAGETLGSLLIGLAAVGLLVGGVGVSNTMIIAVIERRSEIGLRRALGASRLNIAVQFLAESILMAVFGGLLGSALGHATTVLYARGQGWHPALPLWIGAVAIALTGLVGALAGLYPALRASKSAPAHALA